MKIRFALSLVLSLQLAAPAWALEAPVHNAAFVSILENIVDQGAESVAQGEDNVTTAGRWALEKLRGLGLRSIDVDAVKAATHHALTRAGILLSDTDFETLFLEQTRKVTADLVSGKLNLSTDDLSLGQSQAALVEGFGAIVIACFSNVIGTGVCVAAGGVAVVVGIVIIVQALRRPAPAAPQ